jgi:uncharacterized protein HemX
MSDETRMETTQDAELEGALRNFRQSVHAWSEAEFARPRAVAPASSRVHRPWALVSSALGIVLAAGIAVGGVHERSQRIEQARIAAQRQAEQQRELAAEKAKESENLLANIDKDVSREVPSALEPLAQMMDDDSQ